MSTNLLTYFLSTVSDSLFFNTDIFIIVSSWTGKSTETKKLKIQIVKAKKIKTKIKKSKNKNIKMTKKSKKSK